jgi:hypothetical protein
LFDLPFDEGSGFSGKSVSDWLNPAIFVLFGRPNPVIHQFLHFFAPKVDPVGIQSGTYFALSGTCREATKFIKKSNIFLTFCHVCGCFFSCFPDKSKSGAKKTAKLMPEWIPTGSRRLAKSGAKGKIGADWILTGFGLDPDFIAPGCMDRSRPSFAPIFSSLPPAVHQYPFPPAPKRQKQS